MLLVRGRPRGRPTRSRSLRWRLLLRGGNDAVEVRAVAHVAQRHERAREGGRAVVERDAGDSGEDWADLACLLRRGGKRHVL